ncbi:pyruvate dehydrogenase kinase, partial [Volvox carteri f. nagariensis]
GVSLKYLLDFGTQPLERQMLLSARFLHAEIPIRLAHRLMDLNHLPPKLSEEPHVRRVKGWYAESFADFRSFPAIKDHLDVLRFTAMLKKAFRRHNNVVPAIAKGVEEYKRDLQVGVESTEERESEIQHFLDTFFLSRIAIRFLAGHHISMLDPPRPDHIGLVHTRCSPYLVGLRFPAKAFVWIAQQQPFPLPRVWFVFPPSPPPPPLPAGTPQVFELVKNSLRAVQERFSESEWEPPPIQVVVAEGLEDVTIKVSDQGGGIPRSGLARIWTYLYTTASSPLPDVDIDSTNMPVVLAGYGCGLPLSRLYAR